MKIKITLLGFVLGIMSLNGFSQESETDPGGLITPETPDCLTLPLSGDVECTPPVYFIRTSGIHKPGGTNPGGATTDGIVTTTVSHLLTLTGSRVGIGTASPEAKLHVGGDGLLTSGLTVGHSSAMTSGLPALKLQIGNAWTFFDMSYGKIMGYNCRFGENGACNRHLVGTTAAASAIMLNTDGSLRLCTTPPGTSTITWNYLTMLNNGNVGIKKTNPLFALDVNGDANFTGIKIGSPQGYSNYLQLGERIAFGGYGNTCLFGNNWKVDDKDKDRRIGSGTASGIYLEGDRIHLMSAPYGSSGSEITYSSVVVHEGKIGIGNGNAIYTPSEALDVRGNSYISGNVGIGTHDMGEGFKLRVNGKIHCTEIVVTSSLSRGDDDGEEWPDYVFAEDYELRSLTDLSSYIQENKRLPEIPSAAEVAEKGVNLLEINTLLLKKMEEMTLYILQQDEKMTDLQNQINELKK